MTEIDKTRIRDAATLILTREIGGRRHVLMGQRGAKAVFMPNKFVFPGGAVDAVDGEVPLTGLREEEARRLSEDSSRPPQALAAAAIRELWEETGLSLGSGRDWTGAPRGWRGFAERAGEPDASALRYFFRAVTPKGRPRRFDARFFVVEAEALSDDPDDFSRAEDELRFLQWVPLDEARRLELAFITQVVLGELQAYAGRGAAPASVPFFRNDDEAHLVSRLGGRSPLDR